MAVVCDSSVRRAVFVGAGHICCLCGREGRGLFLAVDKGSPRFFCDPCLRQAEIRPLPVAACAFCGREERGQFLRAAAGLVFGCRPCMAALRSHREPGSGRGRVHWPAGQRPPVRSGQHSRGKEER